MATEGAVAAAELEVTTSDDGWVIVGDQNWVIVNLVEVDENHEDVEDNREGGDDDYGDDQANHEHQYAHKEKLDEYEDDTEDEDDNEDQEDDNEDQDVHRIQDDTKTYETGDDDAAHGFLDDGAHCFLDVERAEHDDDGGDGTHRLSDVEIAEHDNDDGEHGFADDEGAHRFSDDETGPFEDEDEEEEDDDYDKNIDAMHDGALQHEDYKRMDSLIDAMDRYYMDPVRVSWQEYVCSVQTQSRKELHETQMASFRGYGPDPKAFMEGSKCFNPLFEHMWLPWAIDAEYCHNEDMGLLVCEAGATGLMLRQLVAEHYMSSAVPIRPLLEYMVNSAPDNKIAHIGSCSSLYWAALLQRLGAKNVIVTEGPFCVKLAYKVFSRINQTGEEMFFRHNMAGEQALFFLRPSKRSSDAKPCLAERCLFVFPGDTVFFVGEIGEHSDNFDMAKWMEEHKLEGWRVEREMEIPCWPGSHDVFLCFTKAKIPVDNTA